MSNKDTIDHLLSSMTGYSNPDHRVVATATKALVLAIQDLTSIIESAFGPPAEEDCVGWPFICPRCDEDRIDRLANVEGDVTCLSCGNIYSLENKNVD